MTSIGWRLKGVRILREGSWKRKEDRFRNFRFYTLYRLTRLIYWWFCRYLLTIWDFGWSFGPGHLSAILWPYRARDLGLYSRTQSCRHLSSRHHQDLTGRYFCLPYDQLLCFYRGREDHAHHIDQSLSLRFLAVVIEWILILGKFCVQEVSWSF